MLFSGEGAAKIVLADLAKFCRAYESCVQPDERMTTLLEGRREVWLRLQEHLQLSEDELWALRRPNTASRSEVNE